MEEKYEEILLSTLRQNNSCEGTGEKVEPKTLRQQAVPAGSTSSVLIITTMLQVINWSNTLHMPTFITPVGLGGKQHTHITP